MQALNGNICRLFTTIELVRFIVNTNSLNMVSWVRLGSRSWVVIWIFLLEVLDFYFFDSRWFQSLQMLTLAKSCFSRNKRGSRSRGCSLLAVLAMLRGGASKNTSASLWGLEEDNRKCEATSVRRYYRVYRLGFIWWFEDMPGSQNSYASVSRMAQAVGGLLCIAYCSWFCPCQLCCSYKQYYMGACCVEKTRQQNNYPSLISANSSFLLSDSSHDDKFLYCSELPLIDMLMRSIITNPKQYNQNAGLKLKYYLTRLKQQRNNLTNITSDVFQKLTKIQTLLVKPQCGYLLFEIQRLELAKEKSKKLRIEVRGEGQGQTIGRVVRVKNYQAEVGLIVQWVVTENKIQIIVEDCLSTVDLNEVENRLFVIEPLNIKNKKVLEPIGKMQVRIQYIKNVKNYKDSYQKMLSLKIQHIQTILRNVDPKNDQTDDKLIVSIMGMLDEKKVRTSFYENDYQI